MIDDLINKSTLEPYRMFTSRAEHRLILRQDNADRRLIKYGYELGLISKEEYEEFQKKEKLIVEGIDLFSSTRLSGKDINPVLEKFGSSKIEKSETIATLCKRPHVCLKDILEPVDKKEYYVVEEILNNNKVLEEIEIEIKYDGYIKRELDMIEKMKRLDALNIPDKFDYSKVKGLSVEAREKLKKIVPKTLGQISRISGITPADVSVIMVYLR